MESIIDLKFHRFHEYEYDMNTVLCTLWILRELGSCSYCKSVTLLRTLVDGCKDESHIPTLYQMPHCESDGNPHAFEEDPPWKTNVQSNVLRKPQHGFQYGVQHRTGQDRTYYITDRRPAQAPYRTTVQCLSVQCTLYCARGAGQGLGDHPRDLQTTVLGACLGKM